VRHERRQLARQLRLAQLAERRQHGGGVESDGKRPVQRVGRDFVLVKELGPRDGFRNRHQKVISLQNSNQRLNKKNQSRKDTIS
jgi:hypothetical protein